MSKTAFAILAAERKCLERDTKRSTHEQLEMSKKVRYRSIDQRSSKGLVNGVSQRKQKKYGMDGKASKNEGE